MTRLDRERQTSPYQQLLEEARLGNIQAAYHGFNSRQFNEHGLPQWFSRSLLRPGFLPNPAQVNFPNFYQLTSMPTLADAQIFRDLLRARKRQLLKLLHPDQLDKSKFSPAELERVQELFTTLNDAFDILENHRAEYDRLLQQVHTVPQFGNRSYSSERIQSVDATKIGGEVLGCLILIGLCAGSCQLLSSAWLEIQRILSP